MSDTTNQTHQYIVNIVLEVTGPEGMASSLEKSVRGMAVEAFDGEMIGDCRVQAIDSVLASQGEMLSEPMVRYLRGKGYDFTTVKDGEAVDRVYEIYTTLTDDGGHLTVEFDSVNWFRQATLEQIIEVAEDEWTSSYSTDNVARFFEDKDPEVKRFFWYSRTEGTGFRVEIRSDDAEGWLQENRPDIYEKLKEQDLLEWEPDDLEEDPPSQE